VVGGTVSIVEADHPTEVTVNKEFAWYAVGHVDGDSVVNPGVAYYYEDGPASSIYLVKRDGSKIELPKGKAYSMYYEGEMPPCRNIDSRDLVRGAIFPTVGTYGVWLVSGRWEEGEFYYHDKREYKVATKEFKPVPQWLPIAVAMGLVAIAGVVALSK